MLGATLRASLLGNMLTGREMKPKIPEHKVTIVELGTIRSIRAGGETNRAGQDFNAASSFN